MATSTLSKFDNISKKLIDSGSPALYQLILKKEDIGGVTKMTLGQKNPKKPNRTILLVGETGTGKSTLINALTNYAMGVRWKDDVWFKIVEEEGKSQSESQTSDVIVYEIFGFEGKTLPYSLTIIDTPGYGDTRGTEQDDIVIKRLYDLFRSENRVHEINVVGLVLKASENRLSDRSRYIFDSVVSLFANDMEKNIVYLFTHSGGGKPKDALGALQAANIKCAKDDKNEPVHFLFNNSQKNDRTEDEDETEILEVDEKRTTKALKKFSEFLDKSASQNLNETVEVLNARIRLPACIQNLQERIEEIELKQKEVQQTQDVLKKHEAEMKIKEEMVRSNEEGVKKHQEATQQTWDALKKHEAEMKSNENFTVQVNEVYKDTKPIEGGRWGLGLFYEGATCCKVCEENCHYPGCTRCWSAGGCEVMEGGHCTVCKGRCHKSYHVKEEWIYVTKTRKVQKTLQDMKEKYLRGRDSAAREKARLENLEKTKIDQRVIRDVKNKFEQSLKVCEDISDILKTLETEMKNLQKEKDQCLEEAFGHVVKLEQIALKADSLSTHVHLDFLIEKMKEKRDTGKARKLEEIKNRLGEEARKGLLYKMTTAGKWFKNPLRGEEEHH